MLSYIPGNKESQLTDGYSGYAFNSIEYQQYRKQFLVPQLFTGIKSNEFNDFSFGSYYQNKQLMGQKIYSRFRDISLNKELYVEDANGLSSPVLSGSSPQAFIWDGTNTVTGDGFESVFAIHKDHPSINDIISNYSDYNVGDLSLKMNYNTNYVFNHFVHSGYMSKNITETDYDKQLAYKDFVKKTSLATIQDSIRKLRFEPNDQYLIGKNTCGLYLNLAPISSEDIELKNNFYNSGESIDSKTKILIPILASSRLTDYYGASSSGNGRIGGETNSQNVRYEKRIGIDILIKVREEAKLISFDFKYGIQYKDSNI